MNTLTTQKTANLLKVSVLAELLKVITQSTVCNVTYLVDESRSKTIKGVKQLQKRVTITHCYLNHDYTNKVRNLSGDTDFVAEELKGKTRICGTLLMSNSTNELMLDAKVLYAETIQSITYFHDGVEITESEAVAQDLWAGAYYQPTEKKTMGRGAVSDEKNFSIINPYLKRILSIKIKGVLYDIVAD